LLPNKVCLAPGRRSRPKKTAKSAENASDLASVFEPVSIALSICVVARDLGQAQRAEHGRI